MSIFAIGDLHLSFSTDKPMDIYGPQWENHAQRVKANWEDEVEENDIVIVVGDISWALRFDEAKDDIEWIHNLPGQKVLIRGNHDLWWSGIGKLNSMYDDMYFLQNTYYAVGQTAICGSRGWIDINDPDFVEADKKIYRRELIRMEMSLKAAQTDGFEHIIVATHYPPANADGKSTEFTDLFQRYGVDKVVYGHLHGEDAFKKGIKGEFHGVDYYLVSLDYLKCKPIKLPV